jgi:hypothetical protein
MEAELLKLGVAGLFLLFVILAWKEERKEKKELLLKNQQQSEELLTFYKSSVDANVASAQAMNENTRATQAVAMGYQNTMDGIKEILLILRNRRR